jgi:capsular polysaccharide biosynthesis protein
MSKEENNDLDLTQILKKIWSNRRLLYITTAIIVVFGTIWTIAAPKEYSSEVKMLSDLSASNPKLGKFSGLASLAGIDLPVGTASTDISPAAYSEIIASLPFQKELLTTKVSSKEFGGELILLDYLIAIREDDRQLTIKKYTLGLPSTIIRSLRPKQSNTSDKLESSLQKLFLLSTEESQAIGNLKSALTLEIDETTGAISIESILPEAIPTAQLADNAQVILEKLIRQYKMRKAESQLDFIQELYNQKKIEYENAQNDLANYQDANRIISNSIGLSKQQGFQDSYNLAFGIFNQISGQLEAKKIEVQESTPVFSIIQPSIIPKSTVGPNHILTILVALFVGLFLGLMLIFLKELKVYIASQW